MHWQCNHSIKRHLRIYAVFVLWLGNVFFASRIHADEIELKAKTNVVFILADDLGWGELGCYGQTKIPTPNIDRLASQGMRFTRHQSGAPVCAPSRCVLMTGKHLGHAEVRGNPQAKEAFPQFVEGQRRPDKKAMLGDFRALLLMTDLASRGFSILAIDYQA